MNEDTQKTNVRSQSPGDEGPFLWVTKSATRLIREKMDGDSKTIYVLSAYHALCENSSDKAGENPFTTSQPHLARLAGCSVRQLQRALGLLLDFGLIEIKSPPLRGPSTYTIRTTDATLRPIDATLRLGRNHASSRTTEEALEETSEEKGKKIADSLSKQSVSAKKLRKLLLVDEQELTAFKADPHYSGLDVKFELENMRRWCEANGKHPTKRRFVNWLNRSLKQKQYRQTANNGNRTFAPVAAKWGKP